MTIASKAKPGPGACGLKRPIMLVHTLSGRNCYDGWYRSSVGELAQDLPLQRSYSYSAIAQPHEVPPASAVAHEL